MKFFSMRIKIVCVSVALLQIVESSLVVVSQKIFTGLEYYSPGGFGQSFKVDDDCSLTSIEIYVSSSAGGSNGVISIFGFESSSSTLGNSQCDKNA